MTRYTRNKNENGFGFITVIIFIAMLIIILGAGWYVKERGAFTKVEKKQCTTEAMICPDGSAVGRTGPNCEFQACPDTSQKAPGVYELFKGIVDWRTENPAKNIQISHCADGIKHNPANKVFGFGFGPVVPGTAPGIQSMVDQIKATLARNGWKKCTPNNNDAGDYYSNVGPWFRSTYLKDGKLLQLNWNFSNGVGDTINAQFEYSEPNDTSAGTLTGKVLIGPICPVERTPPDPACAPSPETYASREFLVLSSDQKKTIASFHADANGNYHLSLSPGTYIVKSAKSGMGYMSKDLPKTIMIKSGQTVTLDIDVDTGIR